MGSSSPRVVFCLLVAGLGLCWPGNNASFADEPAWSVTVSAGAGIAPESLGADTYEVEPVASVTLGYGDYRHEASPAGARATLLHMRGFRAGAIARRRGGRNDVDDPVIDLLENINATIEVGGFLRAPLGPLVLGAEVTQDVLGEHEGLIGELTLGLPLALSEKLSLTPSAGLVLTNDAFAQTFFGVSDADAGRSGLSAFDADGGPLAASGGIGVRYAVSQRIGLSAGVTFARLIADAETSPIVAERGSANQLFGRIGLSYRF
ncbi:MAG: MipA/OmpV family protein [Geminicoccaceae bacterium]